MCYYELFYNTYTLGKISFILFTTELQHSDPYHTSYISFLLSNIMVTISSRLDVQYSQGIKHKANNQHDKKNKYTSKSNNQPELPLPKNLITQIRPLDLDSTEKGIKFMVS